MAETSSEPSRSLIQDYTNFSNDNNFPSFVNLPYDNAIDFNFYTTSDGFRFEPKKHWCFLAEIIEIGYFLRLRLTVCDKSRALVPVAFHTDTRGSEFAEQAQPGYTIAILYANSHGFMDFSMGIRVEDDCLIKILPISLNELFRLNDQVHQFSTEIDHKRMCHGCNERRESLKKCARCMMFYYCDAKCQATGWTENGHKRDCKVLRDKDLQAMLRLKWDIYNDFISFPMPEP